MPEHDVDPCARLGWEYDTDESLGGAEQEWEESPTPDDLTTALSADECIFDPVSATIIKDIVTGCIKGAEGGIAIGAAPHISITKRIRIRHLSEEAKKRLRKKLNL